METLVKRNGLFPSLANKSVNTFFDDFITKDLFDWTDKNFVALGSNLPSVNLKESDTKIEVELAAPGMKKEDFKVEIENDVLMISSEKKEEKEEIRKKDNYVRREFNYQSFCRTFSLPESIDENKIEANYKDGVLHVVVQKKEGAKRRALKSIPIK
ncbi:Hsp20/alpha crystallin family protein [Flavobacterium cellulosilyticum]|uniref:Hsp20/alpha crystallin family protein n=1 Tax=Flavobacterium cellulosilyticum TaxID=2541731 RepID=A0A4R5CCC6_9FLAO|nr:Hsp20/alpha crystallin family protein [Flavobacterium cellulosilyticum]TDD95930.1 Hsp20/alpha crystallin family protein [Flavobacterium cellulosilyticum]